MRIVEEKWLSAGYAIEEGVQQKVSPEGLPVMTPDGQPETEKVTILMLITQSQFEQHIVRVPFGEAQKAKLIADLSGGIVLANASELNRYKL